MYCAWPIIYTFSYIATFILIANTPPRNKLIKMRFVARHTVSVSYAYSITK